MRTVLSSLSILIALSSQAVAQNATVVDAYPDKARYAPNEQVDLNVELDGRLTKVGRLSAKLWRLDEQVGRCKPVEVIGTLTKNVSITCDVPPDDFHGYLAEVLLQDSNGSILASRTTAVDVSSDWTKFPRYGYLAHYNQAEGATPDWIRELNKFHLNGLQFYDFQYRHDQPLAGTVASPAAAWPDIANRQVDKLFVDAFIKQAHDRNMMAMAYNASYSAFADVFQRPGDPIPLAWGTWDTASSPRDAQTVKSLALPPHWATPKLFYMNQNSSGWQEFLFSQMSNLFDVYRFDGWHIDTFGERSAYAFDGGPVDFISGMPLFIDRAYAATHKRVVMNAVNAQGQEAVAKTNAEFVYSELWENHETFDSIQKLAQQVHKANPKKAYVIAAYVNRNIPGNTSQRGKMFDTSSVLLTDATIFALGASHIELGDGDRMLSGEYFPADTRLRVPADLHDALRRYYDFLTAYEEPLRNGIDRTDVDVKIGSQQCSAEAAAGKVWFIARRNGSSTTVSFLNLLGSDDNHWRDSSISRQPPPQLTNLFVSILLKENVTSVGWASPDVEGGRYHSLVYDSKTEGGSHRITFSLPELRYWDLIFLRLQKSV